MTLTQEELQFRLRLDEDTGVFYWRNPDPQSRMPVGRAAGRRGSRGYHDVMVNKVRYQAHRLVWLWYHGKFPSAELDHINGERNDNRIVNLREALKHENQQNVGLRKHNTSGFAGVTHWRGGRWRAQIKHLGVKYHLGVFETPEEAHAVYVAEKRRLHTFNPTIRN